MTQQLQIFDTNIVSAFRARNLRVIRRYNEVPIALRCVAITTVEEQINGWYVELRKPHTDASLAAVYARIAETIRFYSDKTIMPFDEPAIAKYRELCALKLNIGKFDLRIAAIALVQNAVVITENVRDFGRIPGLAVVSWAEEGV